MPKINDGDYCVGGASQFPADVPGIIGIHCNAVLRSNGLLEVSVSKTDLLEYRYPSFAGRRKNLDLDFLDILEPIVTFDPEGARITRSLELIGPVYRHVITLNADTHDVIAIDKQLRFSVTYVQPANSQKEIPILSSRDYCQYMLDVCTEVLSKRPRHVRAAASGNPVPVVI